MSTNGTDAGRVSATPGPWGAERRAEGGHSWCVSGADGFVIAEVVRTPVGEREADAALIASAPDLLAVCQSLLTIGGERAQAIEWTLEDEYGERTAAEFMARLRAAISRATHAEG